MPIARDYSRASQSFLRVSRHPNLILVFLRRGEQCILSECRETDQKKCRMIGGAPVVVGPCSSQGLRTGPVPNSHNGDCNFHQIVIAVTDPLSFGPSLSLATATSDVGQEKDMAPKPDRLAPIFGMVAKSVAKATTKLLKWSQVPIEPVADGERR